MTGPGHPSTVLAHLWMKPRVFGSINKCPSWNYLNVVWARKPQRATSAPGRDRRKPLQTYRTSSRRWEHYKWCRPTDRNNPRCWNKARETLGTRWNRKLIKRQVQGQAVVLAEVVKEARLMPWPKTATQSTYEHTTTTITAPSPLIQITTSNDRHAAVTRLSRTFSEDAGQNDSKSRLLYQFVQCE